MAEIESLQILHVKGNRMTGTIPEDIGNLPYLSWFDMYVPRRVLLSVVPSLSHHFL